MKPLSKEQLAYVAGIVDGEGSIGCYIDKEQYRLRLSVSNTNLGLIRLLEGWFGGHIARFQREGNRQPCWNWQLSQLKDVKEVLEAISPYMTVKKAQAKEAIRFCETMNLPRKGNRQHNLSDEAKRIRAEIYIILRNYNARGKQAFRPQRLSEKTGVMP